MFMRRIGIGLFAAAAAFGLSACSTYGGYGYDGYGYGGRSYVGAGLGYGWYDDYYYPGAGYYVYDRGGRRHDWNDNQRRYWEGRRGNGRGRENWRGYRSGVNREAWQARREAWRSERRQQGASAPAWRERSEGSQPRATPRATQGGPGFRGALNPGRRRD